MFNLASVFMAAILLVLMSCSKPASQDTGGDVQIEIPVQTANGKYEIQRVQLKNLESLRSMRGEYAEFFLSPKVEKGGLQGSTFEGRFAKMSDLWVARDVISLTAASLYYHLQELWQLDARVGVAELKPKRQQVALSAIIAGDSERMTNNAMFESQSKALLFVPYSGDDLPIPVNSGILAHEHFHSLFDPLVIQPLIDNGFVSDKLLGSLHIADHIVEKFDRALIKKSSNVDEDELKVRMIYHMYWLKSINEGLADVWGWAYTGDPDFIAVSLPSEQKARSLSADSVVGIQSLGEMRSRAREIDALQIDVRPKAISFFGYQVGTKWARFFKQYSETAHLDKKEMLTQIMQILPQMKDDLLQLKETQYYNPANFLLSFSQKQNAQTESACNLVQQYLNTTRRLEQSQYECRDLKELGFQPQLIKKSSDSKEESKR